MTTRSDEGAIQELDLDLWKIQLAEVGGLLEAVSIDSFLAYVFSVLLQREPDASGSDHYRRRIQQGHSRQSVVRDLLASGEFTERYGKSQRRRQPIDEFINQTYQDVLGRWPDEDGMQTYVRIGRKWRGRDKVERNILNSAEAMQSGGGRLARIRALQNYARQARTLRLPIIGTRLRRHNEIIARLARVEWLLAMRPEPEVLHPTALQQLLASASQGHGQPRPVEPVMSLAPVQPASVAVAEEPLRVMPHARPALREARIETLDSATATKLQKDGWVFRVAMRDARRAEQGKGSKPAARN